MKKNDGLKISYGLRAFAIYFVVLGTLIWFTLDNAIERLNDGMRQSAESVVVDTANILAALMEDQLKQSQSNNPSIDTSQIGRILSLVDQRTLSATIYQVTKTSIDTEVYITDSQGVVVFDSTGQSVGEDFSKWRDVHITLKGEYGARTSYISRYETDPDDPKAMVIAAPINHNGAILGVVSVLKPINSLEGHLLTESKQLQRYAFILLLLALVLGYLLSLWFTHSLNRIANYANDMAEGKPVEPPILRDARLAELSNSISHMRKQLDGKEYVENYIHSLTHELKTPITSIRGAVELMSEDMPVEDRALFLNNINTSNQRMSRLVERMLSLAKLEGLTELVATTEFDLIPTIRRLVQERAPTIKRHQINVSQPQQTNFNCRGDKVLISQAVANLLDNAISFCDNRGQVDISLSPSDGAFQVTIFNQGEPIPEFAKAKLYDRFFSLPRPIREDESSERARKSTGLGLSFVKEIMKLHKGQVAIENIDQGVVATLTWPIA